MPTTMDRLLLIQFLPIPLDEYLRVELEGAKAYRSAPATVSIPSKDAPRIDLGKPHEHRFRRGITPRDGWAEVSVAPQAVWWRGWDNAAQDAAVALNSPTKGMWRR